MIDLDALQNLIDRECPGRLCISILSELSPVTFPRPAGAPGNVTYLAFAGPVKT